MQLMSMGWLAKLTVLVILQCDEVKPSCGACRRHNEPCDYTKTTSLRFVSQSPGPSRQSSQSSLHHDSSESSPVLSVFHEAARTPNHTLELHLMHHYSTIACHTLPTSSGPSDVWSYRVPFLSFQNGLLLDTVLALAALHLLRVGKANPIAGLDYKAVHQVYWARAIQGHRTGVEQINESTAEAVFVTAALISFQAFVMLDEEDDTIPHSNLVLWWRLSHGRSSILEQCCPYAVPGSGLRIVLDALAKDTAYSIHHESHRQVFRSFPRWFQYEEDELEDRATYERGLNWINVMHQDVLDAPIVPTRPAALYARILSMPAYVPDMINLVIQQKPRALAIFCHVFAMLEVFEGEVVS